VAAAWAAVWAAAETAWAAAAATEPLDLIAIAHKAIADLQIK